jgi:hypothetical protein
LSKPFKLEERRERNLKKKGKWMDSERTNIPHTKTYGKLPNMKVTCPFVLPVKEVWRDGKSQAS